MARLDFMYLLGQWLYEMIPHIYIYPYLSLLTLPPFNFQNYLFFHVVIRADAFIKVFFTTTLTVNLHERKDISTK